MSEEFRVGKLGSFYELHPWDSNDAILFILFTLLSFMKHNP